MMAESVEEALRGILMNMEQAGFGIKRKVRVAVDEDLPFMGYTSSQWRSHTIVVSGFAVKSGMLEGLLTHELSHVYRNITDHPSHDQRLITSIVRSFIDTHRLDRDYEQQTIHQVINHVQDLYADDIAFKVLTSQSGRLYTLNQLSEFFLGWIREEPTRSGERQKDQWVNASLLLNNCFAISNMQRHQLAETQIRNAKSMNDRFLGRIASGVAVRFDYFNRFMLGLTEGVSKGKFRVRMNEYLHSFLDLVYNI